LHDGSFGSGWSVERPASSDGVKFKTPLRCDLRNAAFWIGPFIDDPGKPRVNPYRTPQANTMDRKLIPTLATLVVAIASAVAMTGAMAAEATLPTQQAPLSLPAAR
jgi:hypothetical protein